MTFTKEELGYKLNEIGMYIDNGTRTDTFFIDDKDDDLVLAAVEKQKDGSMKVSASKMDLELNAKQLNRYLSALQLVNKYVQAHIDPFKAAKEEFVEAWKKCNIASGYVVDTNYAPFLIGYDTSQSDTIGAPCAVNMKSGHVIPSDSWTINGVAIALWKTYCKKEKPLKVGEVCTSAQEWGEGL